MTWLEFHVGVKLTCHCKCHEQSWKIYQCGCSSNIGWLGSSTFESHAYQLTYKFAEKFNGKAHLLPSPGILDSKSGRNILLKDAYIQKFLIFRKFNNSFSGDRSN